MDIGKSIGREEGWRMGWREREGWERDGTHLRGSGGSSSGTLQTCVE